MTEYEPQPAMEARADADVFDDRMVIDIPTAARVLSISRGLAYESARRGEIPTIRLGRRLLVPVAQFRRMLEGDDGCECEMGACAVCSDVRSERR